MDRKTIQNEQLCLQVKMLADLLRTKLFGIEGMPSSQYHYWDNKLKKLKSDIDELYWSL